MTLGANRGIRATRSLKRFHADERVHYWDGMFLKPPTSDLYDYLRAVCAQQGLFMKV
jgi:hypothetical protein